MQKNTLTGRNLTFHPVKQFFHPKLAKPTVLRLGNFLDAPTPTGEGPSQKALKN
jgi:hypothetical protein